MMSNSRNMLMAAMAVAGISCASVAQADLGGEWGPFTIGGAMRVNYVQGDYDTIKDENGKRTGALNRGSDEGNFELDTFRINIGLSHEGLIGAAEYRWYDGYSFLHTGWLGYEDEAIGRLEVGMNRTPFGVGAYGPANSFFFDQHYYVGLADQMKLGAKYSRGVGDWAIDLGYYPMDIPNGRGAADESVRYSYAVVPEDAGGIPGAYEEQHQFNARAIYALTTAEITHELGASLKWSLLDAQDSRAANSEAYALALHSSSTYGPLNLKLQLSSYMYDADYSADGEGLRPNNDLIVMGAYGYSFPVASEGMIPSVALSYTVTPESDWADSITFYNDYSVIVKDGQNADGTDFNDSHLNVTGMAIAKGGWYVYVDYAQSDGNYFVGPLGDFGANQSDDWQYRFNINLGYYF
jgi:hypothetical protein